MCDTVHMLLVHVVILDDQIFFWDIEGFAVQTRMKRILKVRVRSRL